MNLEDLEDMLKLKENNLGTIIEEQNLQEEYSNNWINYCNNINSQISSMWNFMLFNDFNNKEISNLYNTIEKKSRNK